MCPDSKGPAPFVDAGPLRELRSPRRRVAAQPGVPNRLHGPGQYRGRAFMFRLFLSFSSPLTGKQRRGSFRRKDPRVRVDVLSLRLRSRESQEIDASLLTPSGKAPIVERGTTFDELDAHQSARLYHGVDIAAHRWNCLFCGSCQRSAVTVAKPSGSAARLESLAYGLATSPYATTPRARRNAIAPATDSSGSSWFISKTRSALAGSPLAM
jgi:hypothetical protein